MLTAVVLVFFLLILGVGFYASRRAGKASDFLVAGRNVNLVLTTTTLAAMQIGAGVIMGGSANGAADGVWPGLWYALGCGGGLIIAGILAASKLRTSGGFVPLDFFAARYGERRWVRIWGWVSNIPSLLGIFVAQIMAAGSLLSVFGFQKTTSMIVVGLVVMIYSAVGGMWGVVIIDFIQLCVTLVGIPIIAALAFWKLHEAGTLTTILATPFVPTGMGTKAVFTILPFLLSISVSYDAYMRFQAAKSASVARWGAIFGGLIVIAAGFCTAFIGAAGRSLFPDATQVASGDMLPHLTKTFLPEILAGVVVAAILAATMSAANCLLLSLAGTCSRDFYNKVLNPNRQMDELKYAKLISRVAIIGTLIVGVTIACHAKGIIDTMIFFNYPYMGSMLVPLLGGLLWKRATPKGALAAIAVGGTIGVIAFLLSQVELLASLANRVSDSLGDHFVDSLHQLCDAIHLNLNQAVDLGLFIAYIASAITLVAVSLATKSVKNDVHA